MEAVGYQLKYAPRAPEGALGDRMGPRQLSANDIGYKLDRIHMSELIEEEAPLGPPAL